MADFLTDVTTLRANARAHIDHGPITEAYGGDRPRVISVLNEVLATELECVLRYKRHFDPATLTARSPAEYDASAELADVMREDLVAERVAIASYQEVVRWLGDKDPTWRRMIEGILAVEEEHADDLLNLLGGMGEPAATPA